MAIPVRIERGRGNDPLEMVRQDMSQLLGHVLGRGFFNDPGDGGASACALELRRGYSRRRRPHLRRS